jgi:hypothetical protein
MGRARAAQRALHAVAVQVQNLKKQILMMKPENPSQEIT